MQKSNNHGGARPGAGRKKGSGVKIKVEDLMLEVELAANMPYPKRVAINYVSAIQREDWSRVENYDRAFLNKIVADKSEVEVVDAEDAVTAKQAAFAQAIRLIQDVTKETK